MRNFVLMACLVALGAMPVRGQERDTGFMVHQLSICPGPNMAEINELSAIGYRILDDLVSEGMLRAWYDLRHGWGDEWNVGVVTVAESHRAWLDYWAEYLRRFSAEEPDGLARFGELCTMHKDNMYSVRDMGSG